MDGWLDECFSGWKDRIDKYRQGIVEDRQQIDYLVSQSCPTLKSRDITLSTKVCLVKAMVFPVVMYGCESQTIKKAEHPRIDAFELWYWRLESPLDCKEIQPVHPEGDQSWVFIGRTDAEAETPILWSPEVKS